MKILVTGGLGHLGSYFINNISVPCSLAVIDNMLTERYCSLFNLKHPIEFLNKSYAELEDKDLINVDVVIHFAALTDAVDSFLHKDEIEKTNVTDVLEFIKLLGNSGVKLFVFPSTTSIYGGSKTIMYEDDTDNLAPQSPYAESKIKIENFLKSQTELNYVICRFGTIFGFSPGMRFHTAINKFCFQAALGKELTIWKNNLDFARPYLGINDMLISLETIVQNKNMWNQTYNILTDNYKLRDIISCIKEIRDINIKLVETPLVNQTDYFTSNNKMRSFGFVPKDNLKAAVCQILQILQGVKNV